MGIKISAARAYQEQERERGKIWDEIREKVMPNGPEEDEIYLKSLVLVRHLKIWAWKIDELGFGSGRKLQRFEGGKNGCWTDSTWRRWAFMVNSEIK
jgi:hypothetical protein